ncbi:glutamate--tRNA ligase [Sulfodiicoccus acidiphilus]|uniref:Glutamate--tRNA ligase n=1 Tax=Sulfodiicoccus acidiphilus TaxID=1670455 RepID=A0A348B6W0_9CREN|nr:glutamate--tRNA ligase [Sulfodiicoccus acidiphilus]BBD73912.1 glutamate--tRNA ligase [Sulfodiicoccus acidiphilus]GGU03453.1 glutamate--tRNA ligase [Sulfodiicoccus acidiphilus]
MSFEELKPLILKYALLNAVEHNGKAVTGAVVSKVLGERPDMRSRAKDVVQIVAQVVSEVNSMSLEEQKYSLSQYQLPQRKEERKELPKVKGPVVTRFAPNPDGPLHLGNARAAVLSFYYASSTGGKFILRFDDTDPKVKRPIKEAYDWIREDLDWLGIKWDYEVRASSEERMRRYYEVVKELISRGFAYVDLCGKDFNKYRDKSEACPHRESSLDDKESFLKQNLELFQEMTEGQRKEGEAVVRLKTDLHDPDPSQRDWVLMRVIDVKKNPHPVVGDRFWAWPTYNLASAVDDHDFGITHIFRAREHMSNAKKQKWIYNYLKWEYPTVMEFGRVKLAGFTMSKSKLRTGSRDDFRAPTLAGLRRRGILPETIIEVILEVGLKITDATISMQNVAAINRKKLDPIAKRVMAVTEPLHLIYRGRDVSAEVPVLKNETRRLQLRDGDLLILEKEDAKGTVRLMGLVNVKIEGEEALQVEGGVEEAREMGYPIVHWVNGNEALKVRILFSDREIEGLGERYLSQLRKGEIVQLVRKGFARVDAEDPLTLIYSHE